jgi:hypothetical protein
MFQRSSDFFRKRLSLCFFFFFFDRYHRNTHQRRFARKQIDCSDVVFPEGSAKCSSRRIRIAEQENFLCLVPVEENFLFSFLKAGAEDAEVSDSEISLTLILSCPLEC